MASATRRIGIFEPSPKGHRFKYVQYLLTHLKNTEHKVFLITTREAIKSDNYNLHLRPYEQDFCTYILEPGEVYSISASASDLNTDVLVVPDGDTYIWRRLWRTGWNAPGELRILVMRSTGQSHNWIQRIVASALKQAIVKVCANYNNVHILKLVSATKKIKQAKKFVPDPISYSPDPESLLSLCPRYFSYDHIKWVGAAGAIDSRKNIPLLLNALLNINRQDFGVVLAGRMDSLIKNQAEPLVRQLEQKGVPTVMIDKTLTDGQLDAAIQRMHSVVMAHSNEGPSGILGKAAQAGTFIIAAGAQSLRRDCKSIPESSYWSKLTFDQLAKSIAASLDRPSPPPISLETEQQFAQRLLGDL